MKIKVEWTGKYPNLCSGEWIITVDDDKILELPHEVKRGNMNTKGEYSSWRFSGGNYDVNWSSDTHGLDSENWIKVHKHTWKKIFKKNNIYNKDTFKEDFYDLYYELNSNDWRSGSCGGCI